MSGALFLLTKFMAVVNFYGDFALLTFRKHFALITQTLGLYSNPHKAKACFMITNTMEKMITILNNNHKQILINTSASIEGKAKEKYSLVKVIYIKSRARRVTCLKFAWWMRFEATPLIRPC